MVQRTIKEEEADIPLVPPGFESLTSFTLKKVHEGMPMNFMGTSCASDLQIDNEECSIIRDKTKLTRTLRRKPWVNYSKFDNSSDEELDAEELDQDNPPLCHLPKGVIRGCTECRHCQKVSAKWRREDAHRPVIDDAPVFYPSEEEFKDTLNYIASIRSKAEPYGICRIVPPPSWNPLCPLKEKEKWENAKFATRVQQIDKLQNRISARKMLRYQRSRIRSRKKRLRMGVECDTGNENVVDDSEYRYCDNTERFGFEPGLEFTLEAFQKYADDFKEQYFCVKDFYQPPSPDKSQCRKQWEPSVEEIEGEYWRIVEKPTEEIEVLYGADIETQVFGSGFSKSSVSGSSNDCENQYATCGWNLNNFSRLPGSVLSYESGDISGVLVPWLYIGMCFSSFCWHVEDHHLYSMNYMHWGAPKIWYGIPGKDAVKLEESMKKHLPDLFEEQPDLLHKLVTQLSPSILKSEGVPVFRCVQNPREFVVTFPRAYHSGFNCGFNCAEAVNVAPLDWLPHGQSAVELYREQGRKTTISHDKLLIGAAGEAVRAHYELLLLKKNTVGNLRWKDVCGRDGILTKALKACVEVERMRRESFCNPLRSRKMDRDFDVASERECVICFYDLHLSASGCDCSSDRYVCLMHAKKLCACDWNSRFFLFRYEITELLVLVEALEGKLSAIHRWAKLNLGLALSSFVTKSNSPFHSHSTEAEHKESGTVTTVSLKEKQQKLVSGATLTAGRSETFALPREVNLMACKDGGQHYIGDSSGCGQDLPKLKIGDEGLCLMERVKHSDSDFTRLSVHQVNQEAKSHMEPLCSTNASAHTSVGRSNWPFGNSDIKSEASNCSLSGGSNSAPPAKNGGQHTISKFSEVSLSLTNATALNYQEKNLNSPEICATGKEKDAKVFPVVEKDSSRLYPVNVEIQDAKVTSMLSLKDMGYKFLMTNGSLRDTDQNMNSASASLKEPNITHFLNLGYHVENTRNGISEKPGKEAKDESLSSRPEDRAGPGYRNLTVPLNNWDRQCRQKGPRIAKVVRRVNCFVELLELGVLISRKLWSNKQAIFPNGFKSRVKYLSILDPTKMCFYVSEILDSSQLGPLFKVTVEECSSEVFIHLSATKCWDMVRERVNVEIRKQHNLGRIGLPPLQSPNCVDGLEMFGFSSPTIIQAIEAMDCDRLCVEYWSSRSECKELLPSLSGNRASDVKRDVKEQCVNEEDSEEKQVTGGNETVLRGLFRKANLIELHALRSMLSGSKTNHNLEVVTRLITEEFQNRPQVYSSKIS